MAILPLLAKIPWYVWAAAPAGVAVTLVANEMKNGFVQPPNASKEPHAGGPDTSPTPTIKLGSKGPAVAKWTNLIRIAQTTTFNDHTHLKTVEWQKNHGLTPDGVVGPKTWTMALTGKSAPANPAAPKPEMMGGDNAASLAGASSGRTWALGLPKGPTPSREQAIVDAVAGGFFVPPVWQLITYEKDGHTVSISGWADALAIGYVDPIRVNVNHATAQRIADLLGLMLPTTRMSDAAFLASTRLFPQTMPADAKMASTERMIAHSDKCETAKQRAGASFVRDCGKDWVNSERLMLPDGRPAPVGKSTIGGANSALASANFGWHWVAVPSAAEAFKRGNAPLKSPGGMPVYQSVGLAHDRNHTDYSQTLTLYQKTCTIDGQGGLIEDFMRDPSKAYLLSDEVTKGQVCRVWRLPGSNYGNT